MTDLRNRRVKSDPAWRLPIVPPAGIGVVTPSCDDRDGLAAIPVRTGEGLRIGGEVSLCFACGPEGSVYHLAEGVTMAQIRALADRLPFLTGYDPAELTPAVLRAYELEMLRRLGRHE